MQFLVSGAGAEAVREQPPKCSFSRQAQTERCPESSFDLSLYSPSFSTRLENSSRVLIQIERRADPTGYFCDCTTCSIVQSTHRPCSPEQVIAAGELETIASTKFNTSG